MDISTPADLLKLVEDLRCRGVLRFRSGDLELELAPAQELVPEEPFEHPKASDMNTWRNMSKEDLLLLGVD